MQDSKTLAVGDTVRVTAPSRFEGFEGKLESYGYGAAVVEVTKSLLEANPVGSFIRPYKLSLELVQPKQEPFLEVPTAEWVSAVDHPAHYGGDTTYEAIKVIEAWDLGFHLGNTVKYISRAGKKDKAKLLEDLKKALWYLQRKIARVEEELSLSSS